MYTINDAISHSDPSKVVDTLINLKVTTFPNNEWLRAANYYKIDTVGKLRTIHRQINTNPNSADLAEYISSSSILHCLDGWTYLSQSIHSFLEGHPEDALHLAYYAELRGGLSFLACQAIGIFENEHYYLQANGNCMKFNRNGVHRAGGSGTHKITWELLNAWSVNQTNANYFLSKIKVRGIAIVDWISSFLGNPATNGFINSFVVNNVLNAWSLDIAQLANDRDVRNVASYRPHHLNLPFSTPYHEQLANIVEINQLLEPAGNAWKYKLLDTYILKETLILTFNQIYGGAGSFDDRIDAMFTDQGIQDDDLKNLLLNPANRHQIFHEAGKPSIDANDTIFCLPVICRALLMSRISTMACDDIISQAVIDKNDLGFWITNIMQENGLGDYAGLSSMADLWADKAEAIIGIENLFAQTATPSNLEANVFNAFDIGQLKKIHSTCFWGLGL